MIPNKLAKGSGVRVISPARSLKLPFITSELIALAKQRLSELGFQVTFGKYVDEIDEFGSSTIEHRLEDLHEAFADKNTHFVLTVIGGFNTNQLLPYLDYNLIKNNPKILCGFSDITALANAIHTKTDLVTYSGPHFFNFGMKEGFEYSLDYFKKTLMLNEPIDVQPAPRWSDDYWPSIQNDREWLNNEGYWILNEGDAQGKIIGGNLCTFNLLQGTAYMPDITDSVLFLEDDRESQPHHFDRDLQSLIHQPKFDSVRGIVIGRFERPSGISKKLLQQIISLKKELKTVPIIGNVDFGHTTPSITFPIGGKAKLEARKSGIKLQITNH